MVNALDKLKQYAGRMAHWSVQHRNALLVLAASAFVGGLALSIHELPVAARDISAPILAINFLLLSPAALLLNAWGLQLSGRVLSRSIPFSAATRTTAAGAVGEVLPLPTAMLARSAALLGSGASPRDVTAVLSMGALLWLGLSAAASAVAVAPLNSPVTFLLLVVAAPSLLLSVGWHFRQAGLRSTMIVLLHRFLSLLVGVLRIIVGFATLRQVIGVRHATLLTCANVTGSFSTFIPAGLGLGEGLATLTAIAIAVPPSSTFAVVATNRIIGLISAGAVTLALGRETWKKIAANHNQG